jgi:hypothetical protein
VNVDWDRLAQEADTGVLAKLAEVRGLAESGRLTNILIAVDYVNEKGAALLWAWYPKGTSISALGLAKFAEAELLRRWNEAGLSDAEARELEPDE